MPWEVVTIDLIRQIEGFIAEYGNKEGEGPKFISVNGKTCHELALTGLVMLNQDFSKTFMGMHYGIDPKQEADVVLSGNIRQMKRKLMFREETVS